MAIEGTKRKPPVTGWFKQWLTIRDEVTVLNDRVSTLRTRLMDAVEQFGEEDDKGNVYLELPSTLEFEDSEGRVKKFRTLKRERHLTPANPLPDPVKAENLLRELKLWMKPEQEKAIREMQISNPYITISVSVDPDAVAQAYFKGLISDEDYDACLTEQKETFQFRPSE